MTSGTKITGKHRFCIIFRGNLSVIVGSTIICVELEKCENVKRLVEEILSSKKIRVSTDGIVLVYNGKSVEDEMTTCEASVIEAYLMHHGG